MRDSQRDQTVDNQRPHRNARHCHSGTIADQQRWPPRRQGGQFRYAKDQVMPRDAHRVQWATHGPVLRAAGKSTPDPLESPTAAPARKLGTPGSVYETQFP